MRMALFAWFRGRIFVLIPPRTHFSLGLPLLSPSPNSLIPFVVVPAIARVGPVLRSDVTTRGEGRRRRGRGGILSIRPGPVFAALLIVAAVVAGVVVDNSNGGLMMDRIRVTLAVAREGASLGVVLAIVCAISIQSSS